jgi:putative selenium metabolism protein SsnA
MINLIGNGILITRNTAGRLINNGCVAVMGNLIIDFGTTSEMRKKYASAAFDNVQGRLIMPGFINTHGHIYSALARGMILRDGKVSKNFTQILQNLWWRVDRSLGISEIKSSAYTTYLDGIRNGVTTVFDHHASAGQVQGSLFAIAQVAKEIGVRTSLCYEVSDRDGEQIRNLGIQENAEFIEYANKNDGDMLKAMFGLHASFTLHDDTLVKCADAAGDIGFHVHVAEGIDDVNDCITKYDKRVLERLNNFGIIKDNTLAVHCIHVNETERNILNQKDCIVVHNPESNMGNAVGCADALGMMAQGVLVGLGTDGYTTDMLESLKVANLIHKHQNGDPSVGWAEAPQMLFQNNAKISERFFSKRLGVIERNALADIILVDYNAPTPITEENIDSHILFGLMGKNVVSTMIDGKYVMKNRKIITVDESKVYADSRQTAKEFWSRV